MLLTFSKLKFRIGRFSANFGTYLKRLNGVTFRKTVISRRQNFVSPIFGSCPIPVMPNVPGGSFLKFDEWQKHFSLERSGWDKT